MNETENNRITVQSPTRDIRKEILKTVSESRSRLTQGELEKRLSRKFSTKKRAVSAVIKDLVANNELLYTYQFGCSFLEKSFNKPVRISKKIVLKPSGMHYSPKPGDVAIELRHGAAFGSGDHPTTRLSIRGIEAVLSDKAFHDSNRTVRVLDIGTGSGVLALVAVVLGAKTALGIDIDPCAIAEARENVKINRRGGQIEIQDRDVEKINDTFSLITANLRYPTLLRLADAMAGLLKKNGALVVSGIKTDEADDIVKAYAGRRFQCKWKEIESDWAGLVFNR